MVGFVVRFKLISFRACLHEGGGPQIGEVTCGGSPHLSCNRDQIKMTDKKDRWVTPTKWVTSPTWGRPTQCNQAPSFHWQWRIVMVNLKCSDEISFISQLVTINLFGIRTKPQLPSSPLLKIVFSSWLR